MLSRILPKQAAYVLLLAYLVCVQPRQAQAVPLVIVPVVTAAATLVALGSTYYMADKKGFVTSSGNFAAEVYNSVSDTNRTFWNGAMMVVGLQTVQDTVKLQPTDFPALYAKLFTSGGPAMKTSVNSAPTDYKYIYNGLNYFTGNGANNQAISNEVYDDVRPYFWSNHAPGTSSNYCSGDSCMTTFYWATEQANIDRNASDHSLTIYTYSAPPIPNHPKDASQVKQDYHITDSSGTVVSGHADISDAEMAELRKMAPTFGASSYHFADTLDPDKAETAPPYVPTVLNASPDVTSPTSTGLNTDTVVHADIQAQNGYNAWRSALDRVRAYAAEHPESTVENDPVLAGLTAEATKAEATYNTAVKAAEQAKIENEQVYNNAGVEALKVLNFDSLKKLMGVASQKWPFSLLASASGVYSVFVRESHPPAFDIPMPLENVVHIDLTMWDTLATCFRWFVAVLLTGGVIFYVTRFWRGVS